MSKKVLILSGSPRKGGNSDLLCDEFFNGAIVADNQAEKIRIADLKIDYCSGCGSCFGSNRCVKQDDMEMVLQKMLDADVIVLASPVYFFSISAQLKTVIDRTYARFLDIRNKEFYYIITSMVEDADAQDCAIDCLRGFVDSLEGGEEKGIIRATGVDAVGDVKNTPFFTQAYNMAKSIC